MIPWRHCGLAALSLTACHDCNDAPDGNPRPAHEASIARAAATRTVAEVLGPVDALAAGRDALFGLSGARGVVFSVTLAGDAAGSVREIAAGEREPFALVARAGSPVWASRDGVFASEPDGRGRRSLATSHDVRALASSPHGIVYADGDALWRIEWPQASKAVRLAEGVDAREIVVSEETVVWLERWPGSAWALDLKSGSRRELGPVGRKGHDLSLANDGRSVLWHEGEADLLAGREPRAFLADTVSGAIRELPGAYESSSRYLLRGSCVLGPAACKPVSLVDWTRLDRGHETDQDTGPGQPPIADDAVSFYWVAEVRSADAAAIRSRIVAAPKDCCR